MLTVGDILKKEREKQGLSLRDVEKKIRVRQKFLEAIEKNDWNQFTSKIYIGGVIKNYSKILGLDPNHALAFFRREYAKKEDISFKRRVSKGLLTPETRRAVYVGIAALVAVFVLYFGYQLTSYFLPPAVTIIEPQEQVFRRIQKVQIIGKTEKEAAVTIFGDRIFQNKEGIFTYDFPLHDGKNELIIEVTGANGKKTVVKKQYVLNP